MLKAPSSYRNRILLITDLYPINNESTLPLAIENFVLALKDFDFKVTVIRPNFLFNTLIRKHKIYKQGVYQRNDIKIYNINFLLPFLNSNFIPEEDFDLIISHMPSGNIYADLLNKKLKLPHISIVHRSDYEVLNDFKYGFYFKNRLKKALNNSDFVGARNCNLFKKLNADFILPSFIEKEFILNKKQAKEELKLITISRLIKRKNIDMVIFSLKNLKKDFKYDIYGEGNDRKRLENLIKKCNLQDKIKIHGQINHNLISEKLDGADIFILPSKNETFGLCYLEAMARGLITIAKKSESMDNIIQHGKSGFLIENSQDIKKILENLTLQKKQEIINNTLENIKNYEKERVIENYIENINKTCNLIQKQNR